MTTRRDLLAGAAVFTVLADAQSTAAPEYKPRLFTPTELELIRDLADTIIPRTDTPSATDVGVHHFVDVIVSENLSDEELHQLQAEFHRLGETLRSSPGHE